MPNSQKFIDLAEEAGLDSNNLDEVKCEREAIVRCASHVDEKKAKCCDCNTDIHLCLFQRGRNKDPLYYTCDYASLIEYISTGYCQGCKNEQNKRPNQNRVRLLVDGVWKSRNNLSPRQRKDREKVRNEIRSRLHTVEVPRTNGDGDWNLNDIYVGDDGGDEPFLDNESNENYQCLSLDNEREKLDAVAIALDYDAPCKKRQRVTDPVADLFGFDPYTAPLIDEDCDLSIAAADKPSPGSSDESFDPSDWKLEYYICPQPNCNRKVFVYRIFTGVPCLHCTGYGDVSDWARDRLRDVDSNPNMFCKASVLYEYIRDAASKFRLRLATLVWRYACEVARLYAIDAQEKAALLELYEFAGQLIRKVTGSTDSIQLTDATTVKWLVRFRETRERQNADPKED